MTTSRQSARKCIRVSSTDEQRDGRLPLHCLFIINHRETNDRGNSSVVAGGGGGSRVVVVGACPTVVVVVDAAASGRRGG